MITHYSGNLFNNPANILVNAVNCVGVMGKGIALQFKQRYPKMFNIYKVACNNNQVTIGKMFVVNCGDVVVVNFPTKLHWRTPSKYEYIEAGLYDLDGFLFRAGKGIVNYPSISIPPLGCANGGLDKRIVLSMITTILQNNTADIRLYNF